MGVAEELGLGRGLRSPVLMEAEQRWAGWREAEPALACPGGVAGLAEWLRAARPEQADRVLQGLVRLGSPRGGDDRAAVMVVAWALLPGARLLAHRLRGVSPGIDQLVAAQLWVQVRTFPWERLGKVAANILRTTRRHLLLAELPTGTNRTPAAKCELLDPHSLRWDRAAQIYERNGPDSATEAEMLLAKAMECGVLTAAQVELLGVLLGEAQRLGGGARRGCGGLLSGRVVEATVGATGLSAATVRRRVRRSILALTDAHRTGVIEAA